MQYDGMAANARDTLEDAMQSDCFYSTYGLVDTADLLRHDFTNIVADGQLNWFNVVAYDPTHFAGDFSVVYQYCGGTKQLNNLTSLTSLDYAYISQTASNQVSYLITEASALGEKFKAAKYESDASFGDLTNCFHGYAVKAQTTVCDGDDCSK